MRPARPARPARLSAFFAVLLLLGCVPLRLRAEALPLEHGLVLIRNELHLAQTGIRAMSLAAHPDDEDGGTLSYLRRTLGVETHACLATRGEGGQNESGPELGAALAVVRSAETERAAKILGAKVWYLNLPDFGYSKSPEETLKIWGHEHALEQLVRVIRIVRPQILFTNHDPHGTDHGHHRATGQLAVEAFDAAADPRRFTESMKADGTAPWSVSKLYLRRFSPQGATLSFDISARDPLSGLSAPEIAAAALRQHASQGMQREFHPGGHEMRYFTLLKSRIESKAKESTEKSMLDGLAAPFAFFASSAPPAIPAPAPAIGAALAAVLAHPAEPAAALPNLAAAIRAVADIPQASSSLGHLYAALREILGVRAETAVSDARVVSGETLRCTVRMGNAGALPLKLLSASLVGESNAWKTTADANDGPADLPPHGQAEWSGSTVAGADAFPTWPPEAVLFERLETRTPLRVDARLQVEVDGAPLQFPFSVPVAVDLAPPQLAEIVPTPVLLFDDPRHGDDDMILAHLRLAVTNCRRLKEPLKLFGGILPQNGAPVDRFAIYKFQQEDETLSEEFRFLSPVDKLKKGDVEVPTAVWTARTNFGGPKAVLRRVPLSLPPTLNVALVKTYDDATHDALKKLESAGLGMTLTLLSPDDLRTADLNKFHTIVLDIRATQYRPEVRRVKERLLEFMRDGGNLLCMYHKDFDWNKADGEQSLRGKDFFKGKNGGGEIAPYPIELSFARVTDETAPVKFLAPGHPLLNEPCKIYERDFEGWVQERGVYFPKAWAPEYTPLLSTNDPGEPPLNGGLLVADVGRGSFIYTSFVWYRELRAGVPGAYRMLANMISYPRVKRKK